MKKWSMRGTAATLAAVVALAGAFPGGNAGMAYAEARADGKEGISAEADASGDFTIENGILTEYNGAGGDVVIPEGVTVIGESAFDGCSSLTSITIPEGVTSIGDYAFAECSGLTSITIPEGVTVIGEGAFYDCSSLVSIKVDEKNRVYDSREDCNAVIETASNKLIMGCKNTIIPKSVASIGSGAFDLCSGLTSITIPEGVTSIGDYAFGECRDLTEITISEGVTSIGESAFYGCSGLTEIILPEGLTSIRDSAFSGCSGLTEITLPGRVTSIGENAFSFCSGLTEIILPEGLTSIGNRAFSFCSGLTGVTLPEGLTSIGYWAFLGCSGLTGITLPEGLTSIGYWAFSGCSGLVSITVEENNPIYDSREGCNAVIETASNKLIAGCKNTVVPGSVTSIGESAFEGCSGLTGITLPDGVTSIEGSAFSGCSGLTGIALPDGVTSIGNFAFEYCSGLAEIAISEGVTSIGDRAFRGCSGLVSITVEENNPVYDSRRGCNAVIETASNKLIAGCKNTVILGSVTSIGNSAFSGCSGLTKITIPGSVTSIGVDAFSGCSNLVFYVEDESQGWWYAAFNDLPYQVVPDKSEFIIEDEVLTEYTGAMANVAIPEEVTSIGDYAFAWYNSIKEITIPEGVTSIGDYAFYGCSGIKEITIPEGVTSIGEGAFERCDDLMLYVEAGSYGEEYAKKNGYRYQNKNDFVIENGVLTKYIGTAANVEIPKSVTGIGSFAFSGCSELTAITIPESVVNIESDTFAGCSSLGSITVEENNPVYDSREDCNAVVSKTSNTLIVGCKNTIIPESVTSIGGLAFSGCSGLTEITIPENVTLIGPYAFEMCSSLESITIPAQVTIMGVGVFSGCSSLGSITVEENNPVYDSREDCNAVVEKATNTLVAGCKNTVIPESVTDIGGYAFKDCGELTEITIPEGVKSIRYGAFWGCSGLTEVTIPESVTDISVESFPNCKNLVSIMVEENNPVYDSRNNCNAVIETATNKLIVGCKNTVIPENVASIDNGAFHGCSGLMKIRIPRSVARIGDDVFSECSDDLMFYVEEGSYGEAYAVRNGYHYRAFFVVDTSQNPVLSKEAMDGLLEKNAREDIIIRTDGGVSFTFEQGAMKKMEGVGDYDFSTVITGEYDSETLPSGIAEEYFILKSACRYSGKLPGTASVQIPVGIEHAGETLCYVPLNEDGTCGIEQDAVVDKQGYITIAQGYCTSYIVKTRNKLGDLDGDGKITATDALIVLQYDVGYYEGEFAEFVEKYADCDGMEGITAGDAQRILMFDVGIITEFTADSALTILQQVL